MVAIRNEDLKTKLAECYDGLADLTMHLWYDQWRSFMVTRYGGDWSWMTDEDVDKLAHAMEVLDTDEEE